MSITEGGKPKTAKPTTKNVLQEEAIKGRFPLSRLNAEKVLQSSKHFDCLDDIAKEWIILRNTQDPSTPMDELLAIMSQKLGRPITHDHIIKVHLNPNYLECAMRVAPAIMAANAVPLVKRLIDIALYSEGKVAVKAIELAMKAYGWTDSMKVVEKPFTQITKQDASLAVSSKELARRAGIDPTLVRDDAELMDADAERIP